MKEEDRRFWVRAFVLVLMLLITILAFFVAMGEFERRDMDFNNPNRPEGCNTTRTSDCYRIQRGPCDMPFAPIMWSDC